MMIRVKRLEKNAIIGEYMTPGASGIDLAVIIDDESKSFLEPGEYRIARTGLAVSIPAGYEGQIRSRSGTVLKKGIAIANAPGTIDSDYRGEIKLILHNISKQVQSVLHGERVAQLVIAPVQRAEIVEVDELDDTQRADGGFGSTGCGTRDRCCGACHKPDKPDNRWKEIDLPVWDLSE